MMVQTAASTGQRTRSDVCRGELTRRRYQPSAAITPILMRSADLRSTNALGKIAKGTKSIRL
jgi:hypothetical protein